MDRMHVGGAELAYQVAGAGEPVVLIHGAVLADFFSPLQQMPTLTEHYQVISYHRIGYGGSSRPSGPVEIADQAEHCRGLLDRLGVPTAHVVGHSSGGLIALQLALQSPSSVASLALLEPSLVVPGSAKLARDVIGPAFQLYMTGDKAAAIDTFLRGVCGPDYRRAVQHALPAGTWDQAVTDADTFLGVEAPSVGRWSFQQAQASTITQPILAVLGARSGQVSPVSDEAHELLLRWFPQTEPYILPGATPLLQIQNPQDLAVALTAFFGRHQLQARH
jgi:pimeloyl-ACP methyl ester carboxylesterase